MKKHDGSMAYFKGRPQKVSGYTDPDRFNGVDVSTDWVQRVLRKEMMRTRPYEDQLRQTVGVDCLKLDASYRICNRLARVGGEKRWKTVSSGLNEFEQPVFSTFTTTDNHYEILPSLIAFSRRCISNICDSLSETCDCCMENYIDERHTARVFRSML
jgi:hypothetical protein